MNIDYKKLNIGDRIVREKGGLFTKHHGIYAGFRNNEHLIAENQINKGVQYITVNQFIKGGALDRIEYNNFNKNSQFSIIDRINKKIGTEYSLSNYNCEHFANEILEGISESKQVQIAVGIAGAIGFTVCLLALKKKR